MKLKEQVIDAMLLELEIRKDYLPKKPLSSIYFGGGTPSLLDADDLQRFFEKINTLFQLQPNAEITLEANPDDLTTEKLKMLADSPVNRLSIGVQSFFEEDLVFMNRAHNAREAQQCLEQALRLGFHDITIDLIYGAPTTSDAMWEENLRIAFDYNIPHLSSYALTVEEKTALHHFVKTGKVAALEEEKAARQFEYLMAATTSVGYIHYEISNFALPGRFARHNTSYWQGAPYLGIGPAAHSFNGMLRRWNVANNALYVKALEADTKDAYYEIEQLSAADRYNEYVMTGLRTIWGVDLEHIATMDETFAAHFQKHVQRFIEEKKMIQEGKVYRLSSSGRLLADGIAAELFF